MPFDARFTGRCAVCDDPINVGETVEYDEQRELVHSLCPADKPTAETCTTCWLEKPCPCEDDQ